MATYRECIERVFTLPPKNHASLEVMLQGVCLVKNPQNRFFSIHVAGTNGKGSVCTKVAKALSLSGYRMGLYTSPHISSYRERISIDGSLISEEDSIRYLNTIFSLGLNLSFFEVTTLVALCYFADKKVDGVVWETGLGGRWDATNVITPILSVITSIGWDHMYLLGNTLDEIAQEKGGIIKAGVPVVLGPHANQNILYEMAKEKKSPVIQVEASDVIFDEEDKRIAKRALEEISTYKRISLKSIDKGLEAKPPCRFEEIEREGKKIILDVAHNTSAFEALWRNLEKKYPRKNVRLLFGISRDKDVEGVVHTFPRQIKHVHVVENFHNRSLEKEKIFSCLDRKKIPYSSQKSMEESVLEALKCMEKEEVLLVCGSFFLMKPIRKILGFSDHID